MGTRGLTIIKSGGEVKVAQYGQWDHYPEGSGLDILTALRAEGILDGLRSNVDKIEEYTEQEIRDAWLAAGADGSGWVSMEVEKVLEAAHPELSRNTGGDIVALIATGRVSKVHSELSFAEDTLFCEGIFEVDLDKNTYGYYTDYSKPAVLLFPLDDLPNEVGFISLANQAALDSVTE